MGNLTKFEDLDIPALTLVAQEQYEECLWAIEKALAKQLEFGRVLLIVKAKLPHGEWGSWVRETFADHKSLRTIQRHMRGAEAIATDPSLLECADSLDGILKIVEDRKPSVEVIEVAADVPAVEPVIVASVKPVATEKPVVSKPKRTSYLYSLDDYEEGLFHIVSRHHYLPTSGDLICISAVECGDATGLGLNNGIQASVLIEKIGSVKPWTSISRRLVDSFNSSGCRFAREIDLSQMQPREGGGHYLYFEPGRVCYYDETAMNAILAKQAETERKKPDQLGS